MKCKRAEQLIIELSQAEISPAIKAELDAHLLNCPGCASFKAQFLVIQQEIHKMKTPTPSKKLLEETSTLCHKELMGQAGVFVAEKPHRSTAITPKYIWMVPVALLILTVTWAVPILQELAKNQMMTQQTVFVITIIVQNILMLMFAPLLLRRLNLKSNWIDFQ